VNERDWTVLSCFSVGGNLRCVIYEDSEERKCQVLCSYIQLPSDMLDEHRELVMDLFNWLVQPCLDYVRIRCKTLINCSPSHLVVMLIRLYHSLLDEIIASSDNEAMTSSQVCLSVYLSVCLAGSLSASMCVCLSAWLSV